MQDFIREYQEQIVLLRKKKNLCKDFEQKKIYVSMIESLSYALREMTGEDYEDTRTVLVDPDVLSSIAVSHDTYEMFEHENHETDAPVALDMRCLSCQESRVLRLLMGGMSFQEVAQDMGVTKSTVQKYAERAKAKLRRLQNSGVQMALFDDTKDTEGVYISGLWKSKVAVH
ncbi:sigma factor-like helix-turn-helix DNA-binding protein [Alicyclobacillus pomorum]|jgi:RNA polymerase sigma factor (sigma-70 family)|uniref:sigma factor-like helix-turn-helix DNA-binding protein n=1 Tax=Alicyclobacillus pomorum TaxID=204470 RepID=UPI000427BF7E|nr:sigma factor-like helix-turn-helix DNA-binding protein [Alicyclobacillus pomorum]